MLLLKTHYCTGLETVQVLPECWGEYVTRVARAFTIVNINSFLLSAPRCLLLHMPVIVGDRRAHTDISTVTRPSKHIHTCNENEKQNTFFGSPKHSYSHETSIVVVTNVFFPLLQSTLKHSLQDGFAVCRLRPRYLLFFSSPFYLFSFFPDSGVCLCRFLTQRRKHNMHFNWAVKQINTAALDLLWAVKSRYCRLVLCLSYWIKKKYRCKQTNHFAT